MTEPSTPPSQPEGTDDDGSPAADEFRTDGDPADTTGSSTSEAPDNSRQSNRGLGLVLGVVVTVAVLTAAGLGVFFLLSGGGPTEADARDTSERFADLYQHELESGSSGTLPEKFESVVCTDDLGVGSEDAPPLAMEETVRPSAVRIAVKDLTVDGGRGTVTLTALITLPDGLTHGVDETLDLVTENGGWRVCGLHRVREAG